MILSWQRVFTVLLHFSPRKDIGLVSDFKVNIFKILKVYLPR